MSPTVPPIQIAPRPILRDFLSRPLDFVSDVAEITWHRLAEVYRGALLGDDLLVERL